MQHGIFVWSNSINCLWTEQYQYCDTSIYSYKHVDLWAQLTGNVAPERLIHILLKWTERKRMYQDSSIQNMNIKSITKDNLAYKILNAVKIQHV